MSQSPQSPRAVIDELYAAFANKDGGALRDVLHPEVEWIQCPGFPGGAHRHGAEDVIEGVLGGLNTAWKDFRIPIEEMHEAGDHVFVIGRYLGTHAESGRAMESVFAHDYEVREGHVVKFRQFADTWPMVAAMRGETP